MQESPLTRRGLLAAVASFAVSPRLLAAVAPKKWDPSMELAVDVTIATVEGTRVHRPYVAVWLEDKDGKAIRTLSLWVQTDRRGPRWIPDLKRWWRNEPQHDKLVETVSSATRGAGKYSLSWDGKDETGKPVDLGKYTLCIEAAREHGTYGVLKKELDFTKKSFKDKIEGNVEIEGAAVELRKRGK